MTAPNGTRAKIRTDKVVTPAEKRRVAIIGLRSEGCTIQEIAEEHGLSRGRVHQIIEKSKRLERYRSVHGTVNETCGINRLGISGLKRVLGDDFLTSGVLASLTRRDLLKLQQVGKKTLDELLSWMAGRGLRLADFDPLSPDEEPPPQPPGVTVIRNNARALYAALRDAESRLSANGLLSGDDDPVRSALALVEKGPRT